MVSESSITTRPSAGESDLARMYDLAAGAPDRILHLADLPWRLASPSARDPGQTRVWEDADGALVAWAVLQRPWHCLDYELAPATRSAALEAAVLAWATDHLGDVAAELADGLPFYVSAREDDAARVAAVGRAGFAPDGWSYVRLVRDLGEPIPASPPPSGFVVRPLAGETEVGTYVAAHRAAFDSANMTEDWRRATLSGPRYEPSLDLIAVGPDGAVAGFCVGWITPPLAALGGQRVAQVEPFGVLPARQRRGVGRTLLLEVLRRARDLGADRMEVDAESYNPASQRAYESVGFRTERETPFFLRRFG